MIKVEFVKISIDIKKYNNINPVLYFYIVLIDDTKFLFAVHVALINWLHISKIVLHFIKSLVANIFAMQFLKTDSCSLHQIVRPPLAS